MYDYRLYLITDGKPNLLERVELALQAGVGIVQYREKKKDYPAMLAEALQLKELCHRYDVPLIINDHVQLAKEVVADGIHLGQSDASYKEAREILGEDFLIGISARSVEEAVHAQNNGAAYIGVGAIFPTQSKKDAKIVSMLTVEEIRKSVHIPTLLIGGINLETFPQITCEYDGICVISGILGQEDIRGATSQLLEQMKSF